MGNRTNGGVVQAQTMSPWLDQETFDVLPSSLVLREVRYQVRQHGFRSRQITLVTTLLDAERYPKTIWRTYISRAGKRKRIWDSSRPP